MYRFDPARRDAKALVLLIFSGLAEFCERHMFCVKY